MSKNEYDTDRDQKTRNAEAQISLTEAHTYKVSTESSVHRAKAVAYWVWSGFLGSLAVKVWFL